MLPENKGATVLVADIKVDITCNEELLRKTFAAQSACASVNALRSMHDYDEDQEVALTIDGKARRWFAVDTRSTIGIPNTVVLHSELVEMHTKLETDEEDYRFLCVIAKFSEQYPAEITFIPRVAFVSGVYEWGCDGVWSAITHAIHNNQPVWL